MKINKPKLKALLTQADLRAIGDLMGGLMDKQAAVLASKQDLKDLEGRVDIKLVNLETNLKDYMDQGFESVMAGVDLMRLSKNSIWAAIAEFRSFGQSA